MAFKNLEWKKALFPLGESGSCQQTGKGGQPRRTDGKEEGLALKGRRLRRRRQRNKNSQEKAPGGNGETQVCDTHSCPFRSNGPAIIFGDEKKCWRKHQMNLGRRHAAATRTRTNYEYISFSLMCFYFASCPWVDARMQLQKVVDVRLRRRGSSAKLA